mgnify:CR=1 FL=1
MNVAIESENPICIRIKVTRLFKTPKIPYNDTNGIIKTWNGITIDAIINVNRSLHAFQLFLTITNAVIADKRIVPIVAETVMISELVNDVVKFIFFIASEKFVTINP